MDEIGLLRERNKIGGKYQPSIRQVPAHECLSAVDTPGLEMVLGLIMEPQFFPPERPAQFTLQHQTFDSGCVHVGRISFHTVSPDPLSLREGGISVTDKVKQTVAVAGITGDTHARRDEDLFTLQLERSPDRRQ